MEINRKMPLWIENQNLLFFRFAIGKGAGGFHLLAFFIQIVLLPPSSIHENRNQAHKRRATDYRTKPRLVMDGGKSCQSQS